MYKKTVSYARDHFIIKMPLTSVVLLVLKMTNLLNSALCISMQNFLSSKWDGHNFIIIDLWLPQFQTMNEGNSEWNSRNTSIHWLNYTVRARHKMTRHCDEWKLNFLLFIMQTREFIAARSCGMVPYTTLLRNKTATIAECIRYHNIQSAFTIQNKMSSNNNLSSSPLWTEYFTHIKWLRL